MKMLERKADNTGQNAPVSYEDKQAIPPNQNNPQNQKIPEINIDEDEIPF